MDRIDITRLVGNIDHIDVIGDIMDFYGVEIGPDEIRYFENFIYLGGFCIKTENGRYAFAQALQCFIEPQMQAWESNYICENTRFDGVMMWGKNNVIGGHGFGYEKSKDGIPLRIKHLGNVVIGKNVEIGSNVCIDRGVIDSTIIGDNTKIDNLVHIAHNVKIGKSCLIVAGAVIGGSTTIEDNTFVGINASIKNKLKIGSNVVIGMGSTVLSDVPDNTTVKGLWK